MPSAGRGPGWDQIHEKEFLKLVSHKRFRPIDGEHTAQMVKGYVVWDTFYAAWEPRWNDLIAQLQAEGKKVFKTKCTVACCKSKWKQMTKKYREMCTKHKVRGWIARGETGQSAEDNGVDTLQGNIDAATTKWHLFADFHASFGSCARFNDNLLAESVSPVAAGVQAVEPALVAPEGSADDYVPDTADDVDDADEDAAIEDVIDVDADSGN